MICSNKIVAALLLANVSANFADDVVKTFESGDYLTQLEDAVLDAGKAILPKKEDNTEAIEIQAPPTSKPPAEEQPESAAVGTISKEQFEQISEGYLTTIRFGDHKTVWQYIQCFCWFGLYLEALNNASLMFINAFENKNPFQLIGGVLTFVAVMVSADTEFNVCPTIGDWTIQKKILAMIANPLAKFRVKDGQWLLNGHAINDFMALWKLDWEAQEFKKFGEDVAKGLMVAAEVQESLFLN